MLIIDKNSVYEIDEECLKRKRMPKECGMAELAEQLKRKEKVRKLEPGNKKPLENKKKYDKI